MEESKRKFIEELQEFAKERLQAGDDFEKIENLLYSKNANDEDVFVILRPYKDEYYKESRKTGTKILGIGCSLILAGFVITCCNFHSNQSFSFAMYGLTSVGLALVFWALYKILG